MTLEEVAKLKLGLYRVYWSKEAGGGMSLAAIGMDYSGKRWIAPTNWATISSSDPQIATWNAIERVELVTTQSQELKNDPNVRNWEP